MHRLISGQDFKKVASGSQRGPEHHGPCPVCGGRDRFHIWPEQGEGGTWWCRGCDKGGDLIEYYRHAEGMSYRDACVAAGVEARRYDPLTGPSLRPDRTPRGFAPARTAAAPELWQGHAAKFAEHCHLALLTNDQQLAWLAARGIDAATISQYGLGWLDADAWRPRESWGLPTVKRADGKPKKLWLPRGLVIPQWQGSTVERLRIRRPDTGPDELKYYVVPGSGREPYTTTDQADAWIIVEAELDALTLAAAIGDLVGIMAMGNATAKPTARAWPLLQEAVHISVALDNDQPRIDPRSGERKPGAGTAAAQWWLDALATAERTPIVGGKDPGEAYQAGVDLRAWALAGLPPRFRMRAERLAAAAAEDAGGDKPLPVVADGDQGVISDDTPAQEVAGKAIPAYKILALHDGREIHLTDDRDLWMELSDQGLIVFSTNELTRLQAACTGMSEEEKAAAVDKVVAMKEVFGSAYVRRGEVRA